MCGSVHSVNEPMDKIDKKKSATATKNSAATLRSFLDQCYSEETSPIHHGFTSEIKTMIFNMTVFQKEKMTIITAIKNGNVFLLPTSLSDYFDAYLVANKMKKELEGLTI